MTSLEQRPSSIDELLAEARKLLATARAESPPREARTLLGHVLDLPEARLLTRGARPVPGAEAAHFRRLVLRRMSGEPVAYLLGQRGFYGRDFAVDHRVLIPRPETEHLIEAALGLELPPSPKIIDIGTGSGAIAITLACELENSCVLATDIDLGALLVARANAARHQVTDRVHFARADLTAALKLERADLVVSNPPYIATGADSQVASEVREFEPHLALFAAGRGRCLIRRLLEAAESMRTGVHLLVEIGYDQGEWLSHEIDRNERLELIELVRDYSDHERTAVILRT